MSVSECDNCGRLDDELWPVRRIYLVPVELRLDEVERWCSSCLTQYPYEPA